MYKFIIGTSPTDAFVVIGGYYYVIIAGFCLFSATPANLHYVETANHTLEEIAIAFGDKAFLHEDDQVMASVHPDIVIITGETFGAVFCLCDWEVILAKRVWLVSVAAVNVDIFRILLW